MRSRATLFTLVFVVGSIVVPLAAHAAGIPFFDSIIPQTDTQVTINGVTQTINQAVCPAGWGMLMTVVNNLISLLITLAILFIAPLMIAYSGYLWVINPYSPGGREKAKTILQNTIIGIVLALAGWLIINALMAVLYNPTGSNWTTTWYELITSSGPTCLGQAGVLPTDTLNQVSTTATNIDFSPIPILSSQPGAMCLAPSVVNPQDLVKKYGFTSGQANVMSCIAMTESTCNPSQCNGNACGLFQIMLTVNKLTGADCAQYSSDGSQTLNCPSLCHGNNGVAVTTAECQPCVNAAKNAACNIESAYAIMQTSGYRPWLPGTVGGSSDNQNSAACLNNYNS